MKIENLERVEKIDNNQAIKQKKDLEKYLLETIQDMPKLNSLGKNREKIVLAFVRDITKNDKVGGLKKQNPRIVEKNTRLIKLVLELEIKDLEVVKQIYNLSGHPFDLNSLTNPYDAALKLFIDEDLYEGTLENTHREDIFNENMFDLSNEKNIQTNLEKFKTVFIMYVREIIFVQSNDGINRYNDFLEELFEELYFLNPDSSDILYTDCSSYDDFEIAYLAHSNTDSSEKKTIKIRQFTNLILLALLQKIFNIKFRGKKGLLRKIIENVEQSYVETVFLDMINYSDMFGEKAFNVAYKEIFLSDSNKEKNHLIFINYFSELLYNLKELSEDFSCYDEIENLSKKEILQLVTLFKEEIDLNMK